MQQYRITNGYCPGSGDKGLSNLQWGKKQTKSDPICYLYNAIDKLQGEISFFLRQDAIKYRFKFLPKILLKRFDLQPVQDREVLSFLTYLEQALPALAASVYSPENSKYHFNSEFSDSLENYINRYGDFATSKEFQCFSSHLNLALLNKIRVEVRQLEAIFHQFYSSQELEDNLGLAIAGKILNRLSTFLWIASQRERILLGLKPWYWKGMMP